MTDFHTILTAACDRHGGLQEIAPLLPQPKTERALQAISDAEYLSLMSRRIFRAGLKHSMVDARWPVFEQVFHGFDIEWVRMMSDEALEALLNDKRIIRHWGKIKSVRNNAGVMHELLDQYPSFAVYLNQWPATRIVELWDELKHRFTQLGGMSGPYFLRMAGKDTFLLTRDVVRALNRWGVYSGEPKTKSARHEVQEFFNDCMNEAQRPLCQISRLLAMSID